MEVQRGSNWIQTFQTQFKGLRFGVQLSAGPNLIFKVQVQPKSAWTWTKPDRGQSTLISSNITLSYCWVSHQCWRKNQTYDCRLASSLGKPCPSSIDIKSCHSHFPGWPWPIADQNVRSWATVWRFLIAVMACTTKLVSGFPSAAALRMASSSIGYFCRCSEGWLRICLRSNRRNTWCLADCHKHSYRIWM